MKDLNKLNLGIYEKALPKDIDWVERIKLVKECGYDFVEISIDETDERLARLDWTDDEINRIHKALIDTGVRIPSMCFSGHRRFPMGSMDEKTREKAMELMQKAIILQIKWELGRFRWLDMMFIMKKEMSRLKNILLKI